MAAGPHHLLAPHQPLATAPHPLAPHQLATTPHQLPLTTS
jgi:hypothetical protein